MALGDRFFRGSGQRKGDVIAGFAERLSGAITEQQELGIQQQEATTEAERVGILGREQRTTGALQTAETATIDIANEEAQAALDMAKKLRTPLQPGEMSQINASLPLLDEPLGFAISKSVVPVMNRVAAFSAQGIGRMGVYLRIKNNWGDAKSPGLNRQLLEDANKAMEKAVKDDDTDTVNKLTTTINSIADGSIVDAMFPNASRAVRQIGERRAHELALKGEGGPIKLAATERLVKPTGEVLTPAIPKAATPHTSMAKLNTDLNNKLITDKEYIEQKKIIINPKAKNKTELTANALKGDAEAQNILDAMAENDIELAEAKGEAAAKGKIAGLQEAMDLEATARSILEGRETIENVKNTFGVPIQEVTRKLVLDVEPDFNFLQPRAIVKSLNSSLLQQQKNRGMMGSFVKNINGQVDKLEARSRDIIKRVGIRALDVPWRELNVRFIGSGHEQVFAAYMKEISAEIAKLAQGSAASIAQLPEENRKEWEKIHDVNLSMKELMIVFNGTREMANVRLQSVDDEIAETIDKLGNVRGKRAGTDTLDKPSSEKTDAELKSSLGL